MLSVLPYLARLVRSHSELPMPGTVSSSLSSPLPFSSLPPFPPPCIPHLGLISAFRIDRIDVNSEELALISAWTHEDIAGVQWREETEAGGSVRDPQGGPKPATPQTREC